VADFGLSQLAETILGLHAAITNESGAIRWMAPELHDPYTFGLSRFERTPASDVYSFACTVLEVRGGTIVDPTLSRLTLEQRFILVVNPSGRYHMFQPS
jgi:serine/threonine protein kinase